MSLRCTQREPEAGEAESESESDNIVAIAVEQDFPRLSVVRGNHKMGREQLTANVPEFEVGDGGCVTRVTPWRFWSGEDQMFEELEKAAAPWHHVPPEVWQRYGGAPRFLEVMGRGTTG